MQGLKAKICVAMSMKSNANCFFGIPFMSQSQNNMFQQKNFWCEFAFVETMETKKAKITPAAKLRNSIVFTA